MNMCPTCKMEYGRSYEEHTGQQRHKDAVAAAVGRGLVRIPLPCDHYIPKPEDPPDYGTSAPCIRCGYAGWAHS